MTCSGKRGTCGRPITERCKSGLCGKCRRRERKAARFRANAELGRAKYRRKHPLPPRRVCAGKGGTCIATVTARSGSGLCRRCRTAARKAARFKANPMLNRDKYRRRAERDPEGLRNKQLRRKYGPEAPEIVKAMFAAQGGVCLICGTSAANHVDHDHDTHVIRGLLCGKCNSGLGFYDDVPGRLRAAAAYLEASAIKN